MAKKPTYKESERRVKGLERQTVKLEQAEKALHTERKRLLALFDGLPAYVYLQGPDHSMRFTNRPFREHFGEPEGRACYQVIRGRDKPCKSCPPFSVFETGRPIAWEWMHRDGRTYSIYDYPFSDTDGSALVLELGVDITDRKQAEEALRESEKKLRTLFEASVDGILITDIETRTFRYANPALCKLLGYGEEEIKSFKMSDVHPKAELDFVMSEFEAHANGEKTLAENIPFVKRDGTTVYVDITGKTAFIDGKNCSIGFLRDVTQRKRSEEELRIKDNAIASSINAIAFSDLEGKLTYVNDTFLKLWGYKEKEVLGKPAVRFWKSKKKAAEVIDALGARRNWTGELTAKRKDGSLFHTQLSASMVRGEDGKPICMMGSFVDITKRKQAEDAVLKREADLAAQSHHLKEVNAALKVLLKQREDDKNDVEENVLSNVKQLVTPHLERLKKSRLNSDQRALVGIVESNLKNIVSPFVSKLSSKFLALTPMEIRVADYVREGKTNKDIAELLPVSRNTVLYHRYNIRTKLGLRNRKINLRSYLLSIAK